MGEPHLVHHAGSYQNTLYPRRAYASQGPSPSASSFRPDPSMYASALNGGSGGGGGGGGGGGDRHGVPSLSTSVSDPVSFGMPAPRPVPSIIIRRLPRSINSDVLGSMLIFAGDLIDTDFIASPYPEDGGFATAVARFRSHSGALEAVQKLNGKPNTTKEANLIIELHSGGGATGSPFERRNTVDGGVAPRSQASSASSGGSINGGPSGRSRYGSTFQSSEKSSPPLPTPSSGGSAAEFPMPDSSAHFQNLFSPQSPLANGFHDRPRVSGKSMINDDSADDETGDILKDPRAYAENGAQQRTAQHPPVPVSRFGSLSLSTSGRTPASPGLTSPRDAGTLPSPSSTISPTASNNRYALNFARPSYPPVNPADQNPPCNTLYVGNLPIDTSEDELKAIFSKQRGYKRLCFRTKHNGPMCFVEFEDIAYATKALSDLYGFPLHNSVKGGIRLSFSKNPLGVRSGGPNGLSGAPMTPQALAPGYTGMTTAGGGGGGGGGSFSAVSGPPPGLGRPTGITSPNGYRPAAPPLTGKDGVFADAFAVQPSPPNEFPSQLSPRTFSGGVPSQLGTATYGSDARGGFHSYHMMGH